MEDTRHRIIDFYQDSQLYDLQHHDLNRDISFYQELIAENPGPCLELACGTGRVLLPLAQGGADVTGIDVSSAMLTRARNKAALMGVDVQLHEGDMRSFSLGRKFSTVILPFNSLAHLLTTEDIFKCLRAIAEHVADDGVFCMSLFMPDLHNLSRNPNALFPLQTFYDSQKDREVEVFESNTYDPIRQVNHLRWYYVDEDDTQCREFDLRIFFPQEVPLLLDMAGFQLVRSYGDYERNPLQKESLYQIYCCKKRSVEPDSKGSSASKG